MAGNLLFNPFQKQKSTPENATPDPRSSEYYRGEIAKLRGEIDARNEEDAKTQRVREIDPAKICPNPMQPRRTFSDDAILRLADSIRQYGIIQPLTVRALFYQPAADGSDSQNQKYELVAGERRLRASKLLGLTEVPCIVIEADCQTSAEIAIIENLQRENLNMFEQGAAIASLIDIYEFTQEKIARRLSTSQSYVANKLRLLKLTIPERETILRANLTERHARALLRLNSPELRLAALDQIISREMNVARTEEFIEELLTPVTNTASTEVAPPAIHRKYIIKDIRIFYNAIDKAVDLVKSAGVDIKSTKTEKENTMELYIEIPKKQAMR